MEPNPSVGAVIVDDSLTLLGEGYHTRFGQSHAEVEALHSVAAANAHATGATAFVTLEPCQHHGKTPPCTQALINAGIKRVVIGSLDPAPHTSGRGVAALRATGIEVETGLLQSECDRLIAPFRMLQQQQRPWVHAKWAMTLDGKTATYTGDSRWISSPESRAIVHQLRGRMDAIIIGAGTAKADDPALTVRPPGPRIPVRVVLDSNAALALDSQLVRTANQVPVILFCCSAPAESIAALRSHGVEVVTTGPDNSGILIPSVLAELGQRQMTNVLLEGGGTLTGSFFDTSLIDEAHVFIAPKIVGGQNAQTPVAGQGHSTIGDCPGITNPQITPSGPDIYVHGLIESN